MIVDDDADMREYIRQCLVPLDYELVDAADGAAALSEVMDRLPSTPALVVTDIVMPRMDGLALKQAMRHETSLSSVPVLLITGEARRFDHGPALRKPFNGRRLRAAVEAMIGRS